MIDNLKHWQYYSWVYVKGVSDSTICCCVCSVIPDSLQNIGIELSEGAQASTFSGSPNDSPVVDSTVQQVLPYENTLGSNASVVGSMGKSHVTVNP